ncbi:MAG: hypothetical protein J7L58_03315 [Thermoplasmata archaeon]|nr:hypothetical protein [Thermoplasmata archaeon]
MRWRALIVNFLLISAFLPIVDDAICCNNTSEPSVWIMHPGESNIYIGYRAIYLDVNMSFAIIFGSITYRFLYGIWVVTNTVVEKVEVYVDGKLIKVLTEPDEKWEDVYEWQFRWGNIGYHKIKVIAYDATMKRAAIDEREVMVLI